MTTIKSEDVVSADLLSIEEVENLPKWITANGYVWWLRSLGQLSANIAFVNRGGSVDRFGNHFENSRLITVRPALTVKNLPVLEIGETVKVLDKSAQYIGNNKVLLCDFLFRSLFDEESTDYETSEVKQKIDDWFNAKTTGKHSVESSEVKQKLDAWLNEEEEDGEKDGEYVYSV